jgi:hypothetical protein
MSTFSGQSHTNPVQARGWSPLAGLEDEDPRVPRGGCGGVRLLELLPAPTAFGRYGCARTGHRLEQPHTDRPGSRQCCGVADHFTHTESKRPPGDCSSETARAESRAALEHDAECVHDDPSEHLGREPVSIGHPTSGTHPNDDPSSFDPRTLAPISRVDQRTAQRGRIHDASDEPNAHSSRGRAPTRAARAENTRHPTHAEAARGSNGFHPSNRRGERVVRHDGPDERYARDCGSPRECPRTDGHHSESRRAQ